MLKLNTDGKNMRNNANKSIFYKNLHRLNHINGPRQSVKNEKNASNSRL